MFNKPHPDDLDDTFEFPFRVVGDGESWVTGIVIVDAGGHPVATTGQGPEALKIAEWLAYAANHYKGFS